MPEASPYTCFFLLSRPGLAGVQLVEPLAAATGERVLIKKRFR